MALMIIDPEGNVIENSGSVNELPRGNEINERPFDYPVPRTEEMVPNSDAIERERQREQIIIAQLLSHPLA